MGAMSTGVAIPDINWAWSTHSLAGTDKKCVAEIIHYYQKLNLRFWWWVFPGAQSSESDSILQGAGLRFFANVPCMVADLSDSFLKCELSASIQICPVKNKSDLMIWKDVSFDGFEMPHQVRNQYSAFVSSFEPGDLSPQKLFLAYTDGKPVASSLLFIHENTAGIYYVSTLPAFRKKGCGLKITQAAMKSARELGFKSVMLQATPWGERVYRRAGFNVECFAQIYKR